MLGWSCVVLVCAYVYIFMYFWSVLECHCKNTSQNIKQCKTLQTTDKEYYIYTIYIIIIIIFIFKCYFSEEHIVLSYVHMTNLKPEFSKRFIVTPHLTCQQNCINVIKASSDKQGSTTEDSRHHR